MHWVHCCDLNGHKAASHAVGQRSEMSENLRSMHLKADPFYASGYLQTWCGTVRKEWAEFLDRVFSAMVPKLVAVGHSRGSLVVIDVGCGPSISNVISASKMSDNIILADILESNRRQVEMFWKGDGDEGGFDWRPHFEFAGVLELNPDVDAIVERTRGSIKAVYFCDVTAPGPGCSSIFNVPVPPADVIIASLVLDVVAVSKEAFCRALENIAGHLRAGGLLVVQGSLGETCYTVGSLSFPAMCIDREELVRAFDLAKLILVKLETSVKLTTHYFALLQKPQVVIDESP